MSKKKTNKIKIKEDLISKPTEKKISSMKAPAELAIKENNMRDGVKDNRKSIRYLKLFVLYICIPIFCSLAGQVLAPHINSFFERTSEQEYEISNEIENLRKEISDDINQIRVQWTPQMYSSKTGDKLERIHSFQSSVKDLIYFSDVHEKSEFECDNLYDAFEEVKLNITDRNTFDGYLGTVLDNLDMVFDIDTIQGSPVLRQISKHRSIIRKAVTRWVEKDTVRNANVLENTTLAISNKSASDFKVALVPFVDYKNDKSNYSFQKSFYDFLIKINNQF